MGTSVKAQLKQMYGIPEISGSDEKPTPAAALTNVDVQILTRDEVNAVMSAAAAASSVLDYYDRALVSVDFNGNPASSIFDANHTHAQGHLLHVMAWYDNEWGFAHRMLDTALAMSRA